MTLPLPNLDDRRWTDLVDEGRALIPLYAPGWTDHNVHDPGITFLELFAAQAEIDLYRINRVPPAHVRKFLALVGAEPRPPRAARTVLAFRLKDGKKPLAVPAGLEVEAEDLAGGRTVFRTLHPFTAVAGLGVEALQTGGGIGGSGFEDLTARRRRGETLAPFGDDPAPGAAFYLGLSRPLPVGVPVSLFLSLAADSGWGSSPLGGGGKNTAARTFWEIQTAPGVWYPLDAEAGEAVDATRSFTADGPVVLTAAVPMAAGRVGAVKKDLFYLRCRLAGGTWDAPPALAGLALNGVAAEQAESIEASSIGTGDGGPGRQLTLPKAPVLDGDLELSTCENDQKILWAVRPDFDLSRRTDSHVLLDATAGVVTFGDGEHGRRLPGGIAATASYLATRADAGNLPADRVRRIAENPHNRAFRDFPVLRDEVAEVRNPVPAQGGAAAETLDEAAARAFDSVERPLRAVTLADYEQLALETPGVRLARAMALANFDPAFPCFQATGVVTVITLPFLPRRRPFPGAATRRAVASQLARRRVIGTRVVVAGPTYVEIAVQATVRAFPNTDPAALRERIAAALDGFFHPITGGPEGTGWPLGRDIYRSEVLQVLDETAGVDGVLALELIADGRSTCGNVCLGPTGLVASGTHAITVQGRVQGRNA